ncbi:adenosylcobyric acid synthase (glutamine-hydrolysing) [Haloactinopolyspora alba]|uniref:Cobyric acid synthase n=1 Tax=Haloactinopolyspora alba TaxID=648780 RepID=A0A2P8E6R7_9ACTN|nr:cobyric acid synthase [Haloactinopolyspora alba]PSL05153.1 adenosylcobyric acid synthase (glutamine-hydrolysing) [Haloactinopolyspora alba]
MTAVMIQGCSSWAGKSLLTTAVCRWYARRGLRVAPFKSQNMSNNARVADGGEIGVAQWLQARAAGVEPDVRMNPVLLKPEAGGSQVVRLGQVDHELSRRPWRGRSAALWPVIENALADLMDTYDVVVIEGAGSPAEINLAANDVVNMRVAERADAPVLLAVDIDRGGAFAHLYGTWALLPQRQRERVSGFVLNRFRGDATLLPPGPEQLERLTGVPTVGVVPMLRHDLPDEDGAALHGAPAPGRPPVAVLRYPAASNLDEFVPLEQVADVRWVRRPEDLDGAATIVLPGSKHVSADLAWLRATGLDDAVRAAAGAGTRVVGVCGGLQLLGRRLEDPDGVDGSGDGLGLLPLTTTFGADKLVRRRRLRMPDGVAGPWRPLAAREVDGYEIRHGRTEVHGPVDVAAEDALVVTDGNVAGWYLHGVFEDADVLDALFGARPERTDEQTFDHLADVVETHMDTDVLRRLAEGSA